MTPTALLVEIRRRGILMRRVGDTLRLRPASAIPPELAVALRAHKADLLRIVPERSPEAASVRGCWRVVIERNEPRPGPIRLNGWTKIVDPARSVESPLVDLELAVTHKNLGRESAFTALIDEYIARLTACGCQVRVEAIT